MLFDGNDGYFARITTSVCVAAMGIDFTSLETAVPLTTWIRTIPGVALGRIRSLSSATTPF